MMNRTGKARLRALGLLAALGLLVLLFSGCGREPTPIRLSPLAEAETPRAADPIAQVTIRTGHGKAVPASIPTPEPTPAPGETGVRDYVLNQNSKRFHLPDCPSVADMKPSNREDVTAAREELLAQGYQPCGNCKP